MPDRRATVGRRRQRNGAAVGAPRPSALRPARPLPPPILDGQVILVAEDEIIIAMEVQAALEEAGVRVVGPAHTLAEALKLASDETLSAAVLDFRLGPRSADSVARVLRDRGVPFLFYSGQTALDPELAKWPDVATISKPASGRTLVKALATLLEGRAEA